MFPEKKGPAGRGPEPGGNTRRADHTSSAARLQVPPEDADAEMACVGSMCLGPHGEAVKAVVEVIGRDASVFFDHRHRIIFDALLALCDRGWPIDLLTVRDELNRRGKLRDVGGEEYLMQLAVSVPSWLNAWWYALIVGRYAALRQIIRLTGRLSDAAYRADDMTACGIIDELDALRDRIRQLLSGQIEHYELAGVTVVEGEHTEAKPDPPESETAGNGNGITLKGRVVA